MTQTLVIRTIAAPVHTVFETVAQIEQFQAVIPQIMQVEFLTPSRSGVGTRFRESRAMGRRVVSTELEVTEYVADEHVRLVSDEGGTIWDTVFRVIPRGESTELTMTMDARPYRLLARIGVPLMKRFVRRAIERDMDAVKSHCERG